MPLDPHEVQTETVRYLVAKNQELAAEVARLTSELAAAQAGPVVEWREDVGFSHARIGRFWLVVRRDGWRLEFSQSSISTPDFVASGPETGPAGKAAAEAAARLRAAGWVPTHPRLEWHRNQLCLVLGANVAFPVVTMAPANGEVAILIHPDISAWVYFANESAALARISEWCAKNLPYHLPPFPGASDAS